VQVAVVTGAGRGLGREIAERLARRQIHVVCTDIDEGAARTTAAIVDGTGLGQDVRDPGSHCAVAREAAPRGELAIWVSARRHVTTGGPAERGGTGMIGSSAREGCSASMADRCSIACHGRAHRQASHGVGSLDVAVNRAG
jgi:NAD(P)-dependent dehydrogenase (short-subunit alcohol dehydrogenase family)